MPHLNGRQVVSQSTIARAWRKALRTVMNCEWDWEFTNAYSKALRTCRPDVVLAEFGPTAVRVMEACEQVGVPLVAHFHGGFDVTSESVVREYVPHYGLLFRRASAVIVVSKAMQAHLYSLGAPAEKVHHIVCGVDATLFSQADPAVARPLFVAVGQFVDFKAPHLTVLAFAKVAAQIPAARLCMIGAGPLLEFCRDLVQALGLRDRVQLLGKQPHAFVQQQLRSARCFVQHSVSTAYGNAEGTPVAVMEASMAGIPVISTRHAGIPDVVLEGKTGFLVDERDIDSMAAAMVCVAENPALAARLGATAREYALANFTLDTTIARLTEVLRACARPYNSQ